MSTSVDKEIRNLIIGTLIVVVFINLIDFQVPLKPVCIKKVNFLCPTGYVYIKFNNCKTPSDKDLQDNYCILSSRSSFVTSSHHMLTCANLEPQKTNFELTNAKIHYAFCLFTLWFAVNLMLINYNRHASIKLSVSMTILIKCLLFILVILLIIATFRSLISIMEIYNCFVLTYASVTSRILIGFYGLATTVISYKLKNYRILGVLFLIYGISLFGF